MPSKLKTGWKCIGRSGKTVDGRVIKESDIVDAAETFDKEIYGSLIWPDHQRWYNFGGIEKLRHEKNKEGGVDLFAILSPNEFYLQANQYGQRLFTSMELQEDFRGTGRTYLTGLGATDNPASAATTEVRFSRIDEKNILLSEHVENTTHEFEDDEQAPGWFKTFTNQFNSKTENDMSKEAVEKLQTQLTALATKFAAAFPAEEKQASEETKFSAEKAIADLTARFSDIEKAIAGKDEKQNKESTELYTELKAAFDELSTKFSEALKEQPGTAVEEDAGGDGDDKDIV